jgi:hypothetical protein
VHAPSGTTHSLPIRRLISTTLECGDDATIHSRPLARVFAVPDLVSDAGEAVRSAASSSSRPTQVRLPHPQGMTTTLDLTHLIVTLDLRVHVRWQW